MTPVPLCRCIAPGSTRCSRTAATSGSATSLAVPLTTCTCDARYRSLPVLNDAVHAPKFQSKQGESLVRSREVPLNSSEYGHSPLLAGRPEPAAPGNSSVGCRSGAGTTAVFVDNPDVRGRQRNAPLGQCRRKDQPANATHDASSDARTDEPSPWLTQDGRHADGEACSEHLTDTIGFRDIDVAIAATDTCTGCVSL